MKAIFDYDQSTGVITDKHGMKVIMHKMTPFDDESTKEKLDTLNELGFSNGFISRNTNISAARIFNVRSDRKVALTTAENERIAVFYDIAKKLVSVGGEV
jgi:hypothetical protein